MQLLVTIQLHDTDYEIQPSIKEHLNTRNGKFQCNDNTGNFEYICVCTCMLLCLHTISRHTFCMYAHAYQLN